MPRDMWDLSSLAKNRTHNLSFEIAESYHWITKEVPKHIFNLDEYVEIMGVGIKAKGTFLFNSIIWNN